LIDGKGHCITSVKETYIFLLKTDESEKNEKIALSDMFYERAERDIFSESLDQRCLAGLALVFS